MTELQNQALRSVLQLLAYGGMDGSDMDDDDDDGSGGDLWTESDDEDDGQDGAGLNVRRAGRLLFYSPDTAGSSYDEDETAASVGAQVVSSLRGRTAGRRTSRRPRHPKPSPELLEALNSSDFRYLLLTGQKQVNHSTSGQLCPLTS